MQGDVPEPARFSLDLQHDRRTFIAADVAVCPFPIRPAGGLFQDRIPFSQAEFPLDQCALPAGIYNDVGSFDPFLTGFVLKADTDSTVSFKQNFEDSHTFMHADPVFGCVLQHHLIELTAPDLPGLGRFVRLVVDEVEWLGQSTAGTDELNAVLLDVVTRLHLRQHVQSLHDPVGLGNQ